MLFLAHSFSVISSVDSCQYFTPHNICEKLFIDFLTESDGENDRENCRVNSSGS